MTVIDKDRAFWILQEAFDYIRGSAAVNWDALRLILEAQSRVFASFAPRTPYIPIQLQKSSSLR
jgi:hypothetical protein